MRLPWRRQPEPPTNVRVVLDDGTEVPVDLVYVGRRHGMHHWVAAWPVAFPLDGRLPGLRMDCLPGRTSIELDLRPQWPS